MSRPWMPLYVADYLADTAHLRALESGAYLHLIMHYWQRGSLPDNDRQLATIARMTDDEWAEWKSTLAALFQPGWRHKRIDRELAEAGAKYARRAAAGRVGGRRKPEALLKQCSSNADALLNQPQPQPHTEELRSSVTRARAKTGEFEAWYGQYPHKIGRAAAQRAFTKARSLAEFVDLVDGLKRYIEAKPPDRQWCNPATWLNQERWKDQPATEISNGKAASHRTGKDAFRAELDRSRADLLARHGGDGDTDAAGWLPERKSS